MFHCLYSMEKSAGVKHTLLQDQRKYLTCLTNYRKVVLCKSEQVFFFCNLFLLQIKKMLVTGGKLLFCQMFFQSLL